MSKFKKPLAFLLLFTGIASLIVLAFQPIAVFHYKKYLALIFPAGMIALKERNLLFVIQALMLIIVIPVYIMTFIFAWIYRAGNNKAKYDPDLVDHKIAEYFWWGVPTVLTLIICVITWVKTYELDPYRPIESDKKPLTVQVVSLEWKWLFIYPELGIATVNFLQIPTNRPIHFEISADSPMNSFWIPHLGGQIYAMPNMKSELYLIADEEGDFRGSSANISGEGFSQMHFVTRASSEEDFGAWVNSVGLTAQTLNIQEYEKLSEPNLDQPVVLYRLAGEDVFHWVLMKYMHPRGK